MDPVWKNSSEMLRYEFEHKALPGFLFGPSSEDIIKFIIEEGVDAFLEYGWRAQVERLEGEMAGYPLWQIQ